ncbi:unnamed protein product [Coffea canephora]|uniref:DH200=94 genomic scaffold, scaffold_3782 n=1 Tax=Coffea canephora TaxID=49390 RepID=A0A068VL09_COFCA|nr:unnamed protein product [Coffea canephora]
MKCLCGAVESVGLKELASSEPGQLSAFNVSITISSICGMKIEEVKKLDNQVLEESEKALLKAHNLGALIHHLSLLCNKRCLMAYVYNRAETMQSLGWAVERVLPEEIEEKLSASEKEYFKKRATSLQSCMSELDLDLAVDMVPPKDPYIKVRALADIGNVTAQ